jgi:hypothetical protein
MMHGREKSDPAIVARKPANNAGQPAAERVERRAGTEGNAGQQSTRRAQDRESVSQALERVRKPQSKRGRSGSPRSSTTSTPKCFAPRSSR